MTTEGSIRFAPLPEHCRKAHAQYIANRKAWVDQEVKKLKQINPYIRAVRVLTRCVCIPLKQGHEYDVIFAGMMEW